MMPMDIPPSLSSPVTAECVVQAAQYQAVPLAALLAIMDVEGGQVGRVSYNDNGSYDIGPMQINSRHLNMLKARGIPENMLLYNGCVNVAVGAYLLAREIHNGHDDPKDRAHLWRAIGNYHSRTPSHNAKYQRMVWERLKKMPSVIAVIQKANRSLVEYFKRAASK